LQHHHCPEQNHKTDKFSDILKRKRQLNELLWKILQLVRFQVLTVTSIKMAVFWGGKPCSLAEDVSDMLTASIIKARMK
jgi:hypothetical protein